jgi:hypothetical protein
MPSEQKRYLNGNPKHSQEVQVEQFITIRHCQVVKQIFSVIKSMLPIILSFVVFQPSPASLGTDSENFYLNFVSLGKRMLFLKPGLLMFHNRSIHSIVVVVSVAISLANCYSD